MVYLSYLNFLLIAVIPIVILFIDNYVQGGDKWKD